MNRPRYYVANCCLPPNVFPLSFYFSFFIRKSNYSHSSMFEYCVQKPQEICIVGIVELSTELMWHTGNGSTDTVDRSLCIAKYFLYLQFVKLLLIHKSVHLMKELVLLIKPYKYSGRCLAPIGKHEGARAYRLVYFLFSAFLRKILAVCPIFCSIFVACLYFHICAVTNTFQYFH